MNEMEVRIVHLEPMRVACAAGFGGSPEPIAWKRLLTWARSVGLLEDPESARYFGFNSPSPSSEGEEYGYEQWLVVRPGVTAADGEAKAAGIETKEFPGGLYAVTRCIGLADIGETWTRLGQWVETSDHEVGEHQWLEECLAKPRSWEEFEQLSPDSMVLDLYCPIVG